MDTAGARVVGLVVGFAAIVYALRESNLPLALITIASAMLTIGFELRRLLLRRRADLDPCRVVDDLHDG